MSNVVILRLLGPHQTGTLRNAFRSPSTEVDEGIDVCFLLVGAAQSLRARAQAGYRKPALNSERHLPNAMTGADIPNDTVLQVENVFPGFAR